MSPLPTPLEEARGLGRAEAPRTRPWSTWLFGAALAIIVIVVALVAWWLTRPGIGPADPGGRILRQLETVRVAVPAGAHVDDAQFDEPHTDSCDGRPGTFGWDDAVVQIVFGWSGPGPDLLAGANERLAVEGWATTRPAETTGTAERWTRRLHGGAVAQAILETEGGGGWILVAMAPPYGRPVSGC
ncbi:MAG TPA: hypothetical protein VKG43_06765 [Acidimicrobiales bacterium]|nr:hypothetical protein [Acidimicrobiales bacterium]